TTKVWEVATGRLALTLRGHRNSIRDVAFSPDGRRLATAGARPARRGDQMPDELKLWDVATGRELLNVPDAGHAVAFSPDGRRLVTAGEKGDGRWDPEAGLLILDVTTGQVLLRICRGGHAVVFSPDGTFLASISGGGIRLWDATTGAEIRILKGHSGRIDSLAISPDGKRLVSGGKDDKTVKVWDVASGEELFTYRGHTARVHCLALSPDGR